MMEEWGDDDDADDVNSFRVWSNWLGLKTLQATDRVNEIPVCPHINDQSKNLKGKFTKKKLFSIEKSNEFPLFGEWIVFSMCSDW